MTTDFQTEEIANLAYDLLASSTVNRYIKMVKFSAARSDLTRRIKQNPSLIDKFVEKAKQLWYCVMSSSQRDIEEVELALLLGVLSRAPHVQFDDLLLDIVSVRTATTFWLSGLAAKIKSERIGEKAYAFANDQEVKHRTLTTMTLIHAYAMQNLPLRRKRVPFRRQVY